MQKEYQLYLFSQLFHATLKDCLEDEPYDLLFPIIVNELEKFEESDGIFWVSTIIYNIWCETEDSRRMDPACIREDRLKELGI